MCRTAVLLGVMVLAQGSASAQQTWVDAIFPEDAHSFGTVARGSKVKHTFRIVNTTNQDIHLLNWSTKCGCTDVKVGARDIPPGTQTFVEATLDTTKFLGQKNSGLTLFFDRPNYAQKDLSLSCFIRGDILLNPGTADFGVIGRSSGNQQVMQLSYFGGQPNWGITKIDTISAHVTAEAEEIAGTRTQTSVQYRLTVDLASTIPNGYFKDEITLHTNDPASERIPVSVTANVQGAVVVTPSVLTLGSVKPGQVITKDILVRSSQPFTITEAASKQGDLSAGTMPETPKTLHKLTVTLKVPNQAGPHYAMMELKTSVKDEPPLKLTAFATVVP